METLPSRDSPHPRDTLMKFANLPAKRRSPGRVLPASRDVLHTPLRTAKSRSKVVKGKQRTRIQEPEPTPRQRGRPAATIATGMTKNTFVKKCQELDRAIRDLKESMFVSLFFFACSLEEYEDIDPDLLQSWHLSRLNLRTQTLVKVGENAAALVDSYPATAPERITLRQHLCQSMLSLVLFHWYLTTRCQILWREGSIWYRKNASVSNSDTRKQCSRYNILSCSCNFSH